MDLFKEEKPIEKLLRRFETKLQSANVLLKDAEEKQLADEDVRKWLHNLKEVIFRADELTDKIDYEVLRRKLEGASISSTFSAKFGKSVEDEIEDILADLESLLNQNAVLGIVKLLQRFETKLQSANVLLKDAEEKQLEDEDVRKWLHNLKEVIFRADELTDKIDYEVLKCKLEGAVVSLTFVDSVQEEMKEILLDLEDLLRRTDDLTSRKNALSLGSRGMPLVRESEVYGRKADKEAILKFLLPDEDCGDKIPVVIPIVGMDGIGKSTLAQLVYEDQGVKERFGIRAWVSVSTESAVKITEQIFEQVKSEALGNTELFLLQGKVKKALETQKFLFVLDGVWNEDHSFWDQLGPLFTFGASGSTIVITTSSSRVAESALENNRGEIYHLGVLEDSICWDSFIRHAIKHVDLNAHPDLRKIGEEIVRKCGGLPVAVKSVAALLRTYSLERWRTILDNKIWDWKLQEITSKYILPALWLSYSHLSPELKRCFAYCSIFPKDHEYLMEDLILLWTAEGLVQSKGEATMEDVGKEYFKILTSRSFFHQRVESEPSFTMHGCMHDLATFVFGDFGFRLEKNNLQKLPEKARHLSIMTKDIRNLEQFEGLSNAKFLRTFLTLGFNRSSQHMVPLQELLMKEEWLRVVSLSHYLSITELPDSVGKSKHLRYLDLSCTAIKEIPSTVCSLYNLETLLLKRCENLTRLPAEIERLLKIRHIHFDNSPVIEFPLKICNLKELQSFTRFIVGEEYGGSRIEELGDLQHLHGKFDIWGLENVDDVQNVSAAKLSDKKFHMLGLYWNGGSAGSSDPGQHRLVLDQLQPHTKLEELYIRGYNGKSFSDWMGDRSFEKIQRVELVNCGDCNSLSPIEQLPSLKELWISEWPVEKVSLSFNSNGSSTTKPFENLKALYFLNMRHWKEWSFTGSGKFPRLTQLQFFECPKLDVRLPAYFPVLTKLVVNCCRRLMPCEGVPSLKELQIRRCTAQEYFSNKELGLPSSAKILVH